MLGTCDRNFQNIEKSTSYAFSRVVKLVDYVVRNIELIGHGFRNILKISRQIA
jgi:uncharacterized protein with HEPN domain